MAQTGAASRLGSAAAPLSNQSQRMDGAAEQRDAADEGRLEPCGDAASARVIVNEDAVVRPSQLIASVRLTWEEHEG
jgi:hypothetical protein